MILWKDFLFDDVLGPSLICGGELIALEGDLLALQDALDGLNQVQGDKATVTSVMDDARGALGNAPNNQETRDSQQPARMVGQTNLGVTEELGREAEYGSRTALETGGEA